MRYRVNIIIRRAGEAPDTKLLSRQLPDGFATLDAAVEAAELVLDAHRGQAGFVTTRFMDGFTAVYVSERAWK